MPLEEEGVAVVVGTFSPSKPYRPIQGLKPLLSELEGRVHQQRRQAPLLMVQRVEIVLLLELFLDIVEEAEAA